MAHRPGKHEGDRIFDQTPNILAARSQLFFKSSAEAVAHTDKFGWLPLTGDTTIPDTDEQRQQWVLKLVAAYKDISRYEDQDEGRTFKSRWYDPARPELGYKNYYKPIEIERVCWKLVDTAEQLHRYGTHVLDLHNWGGFPQPRSTSEWTFEKRLNAVVILLSKLKTRCDGIMNGSSLGLILYNPEVNLELSLRKLREAKRRKKNVGTKVVPGASKSTFTSNNYQHSGSDAPVQHLNLSIGFGVEHDPLTAGLGYPAGREESNSDGEEYAESDVDAEGEIDEDYWEARN